MSEWTLDRVLNLALRMEEQSIQLYTSAQDTVSSLGSKKLLGELVVEEERHRNNILEAMENPEKIREIGSLERKIEDLKIVDTLVDVPLSPGADYQQILIYAGKREKDAHDLYIELAARYRNKQIGMMFARFAQEELKHKYRLEQEYDEVVLREM